MVKYLNNAPAHPTPHHNACASHCGSPRRFGILNDITSPFGGVGGVGGGSPVAQCVVSHVRYWE